MGSVERVGVPRSWSLAVALLCLCLRSLPLVGGKANTFFYNPVQPTQPQLILISGCTGSLPPMKCTPYPASGTGKSTFGMSVALSQGLTSIESFT